MKIRKKNILMKVACSGVASADMPGGKKSHNVSFHIAYRLTHNAYQTCVISYRILQNT